MCLDEAIKFCTWGDGDSLDRERESETFYLGGVQLQVCRRVK